jgi:hydrogenase expression/formation protein HypE
MRDKIRLGHGSGGSMTHELIHDHFADRFGMQEPMTDSAVLEAEGTVIAFTTDSYVVEPLFFPGGDIGKLAVCGTVNDLAVSGARPLYISASFVIEEGFGLDELDVIISSMATEARTAGIKIVTGDTKVVGKGKCDGLFINTSGVGVLNRKHIHIGNGTKVSEGDSLIVSGPPGDHAATILALRSNLSFDVPLKSDCAALNHMTDRILERTDGVNFMRDITRGGLAAVLNELASMRGCGITVDESAIPLREEVRGLCEILGFDPLAMACEGRMVVVASPEDAGTVLDVMHSFPEGEGAAVIGEITGERKGSVILNTAGGGQRFLEMPSGLLLPRIC